MIILYNASFCVIITPSVSLICIQFFLPLGTYFQTLMNIVSQLILEILFLCMKIQKLNFYSEGKNKIIHETTYFKNCKICVKLLSPVDLEDIKVLCINYKNIDIYQITKILHVCNTPVPHREVWRL